jgi:hypothetical protein
MVSNEVIAGTTGDQAQALRWSEGQSAAKTETPETREKRTRPQSDDIRSRNASHAAISI